MQLTAHLWDQAHNIVLSHVAEHDLDAFALCALVPSLDACFRALV